MLHKRDYNCHKCSKQYGGQTILNIHLLSHKRRPPKTTAEKEDSARMFKRQKTEKQVVKKEPIDDMNNIKVEPL